MISATHFVEVITVKNGPPNIIQCGGCILPGSGSWSITAQGQGKTWFNNRNTFPIGDYKLTYLGGTQLKKKVCSGCGDFSWYTGRVAEPISSSTLVDLTSWTVHNYRIPPQSQVAQGNWTVTSGNAIQTANGQATFLVSDFNLIDNTFIVDAEVVPASDFVDNDFFGVAWGLSINNSTTKPDSYYLLQWKASDADGGYGGIEILRVVNSGNETGTAMYSRLWDGVSWTDGTAQIMVLAQSPKMAWRFNITYSIRVIYNSDGSFIVSVSDQTGLLLWTTTFKDPQPLGTGKVAFYDLSLENVHFTFRQSSSAGFIYVSPEGSVCTADKNSITFNGQSDDVVILYQADDSITENYDGIPGDPVTINIPANHVIFQDTSGFMIGTPVGTPNTPRTAQKTFVAGVGTAALSYTVPAGTLSNRGTGHVTDLIPAGFNIKKWGEAIPISELSTKGWIDQDGTFRFNMALIPCGLGNALVNGVTCSAISVPPPSTTYDWRATTESAGVDNDVDNLPTIVGSSIKFSLSNTAEIGVNLVQTPSSLSNINFQLERLSSVITASKQISWVQENPGGRYLTYDFEVVIDDVTYSTQNDDNIGFFYFNDNQWTPGNKLILPLGNATVKFNIPADTTSKTATVTVIVNGSTTTATTKLVPIVPRTIVRTPIVFGRDLLDPTIPGLTAKTAAFRRSINIMSFSPYLYNNGKLVAISWDLPLSNSDRLVCISNDVTTQTAILYHLQNTKGILPHRNV